MYDVIVIGAGPSGCFCAITASKRGKKVLLIEKNNEIGKKLKLTGGGRCNITNLKDRNEFIKNLPLNNGRFLYSSLNNLNPSDIVTYFENLGIPLKTEKNDKVFPISNNANDFINVLKDELEKNNIVIKYNTEVIDLLLEDEKKIVKTDKGDYYSKNVVIATGGKSYPHTGSTGIGYILATKLNHTVTKLFPTESGVISHDPIINSKELQGLSFTDVKLSLIDNNKIIKTHQDDLIITHFGLSGPAALKLSQFVYHHLLTNKEALLHLDILPNLDYEYLIDDLKNKRNLSSHKNFKNVVKDLSSHRFIDYVFKILGFNEYLKMSDISNKQINDFVNLLKKFPLKVHEVKPIQVAFVTGGGVSLNEINPKTMESKIAPGVYFIGEVLDIHGYTGGYNITIALTTGYTAGLSIN